MPGDLQIKVIPDKIERCSTVVKPASLYAAETIDRKGLTISK